MCKSVHGEDKYDYSITEGAKNKLSKIHYICRKHNIVIEQVFNNHLQGKGCKLCGNENSKEKRTNTVEEFLTKVRNKNKINLDNYDFTKFDLNKRDDKGRVKFICKKHGEYYDWPSNFIKGHGCHICMGKDKDDNEVIVALSKIHPNLDFSEAFYSKKDSLNRLKVKCNKHGIQYINYNNLINGQGCNLCGYERMALKNTLSNDEIISKSKQLFTGYTYDKVDSFNRDENGKIIVTCNKHGDFKISPYNLLQCHGCPKCNESKSEKDIRLMLETNRINYVYQCTNSTLPFIKLFKLDFYLPDYKIAIECQGLQHFAPNVYFGGIEAYKLQKKRDKEKLKLCNDNGIKILYYSNFNYDFPYYVYTDLKILENVILSNNSY